MSLADACLPGDMNLDIIVIFNATFQSINRLRPILIRSSQGRH